MKKITNLDKKIINANGEPLETTVKNQLNDILSTLDSSDIPMIIRMYNKVIPDLKTAKKEIEVEDADFEIIKTAVGNAKIFLFAKAQLLEALGEK
ncbi:MAG TPA: hypothetical protein VFQ86_01850 [Arachidicoccus soli]|nr:hypothetical protein [Arachidicoccus soli]